MVCKRCGHSRPTKQEHFHHLTLSLPDRTHTTPTPTASSPLSPPRSRNRPTPTTTRHQTFPSTDDKITLHTLLQLYTKPSELYLKCSYCRTKQIMLYIHSEIATAIQTNRLIDMKYIILYEVLKLTHIQGNIDYISYAIDDIINIKDSSTIEQIAASPLCHILGPILTKLNTSRELKEELVSDSSDTAAATRASPPLSSGTISGVLDPTAPIPNGTDTESLSLDSTAPVPNDTATESPSLDSTAPVPNGTDTESPSLDSTAPVPTGTDTESSSLDSTAPVPSITPAETTPAAAPSSGPISKSYTHTHPQPISEDTIQAACDLVATLEECELSAEVEDAPFLSVSSLVTLPPILCINLQRLTDRKDTRYVAFDEKLDISKYCDLFPVVPVVGRGHNSERSGRSTRNGSIWYDLCAVVTHRGGSAGGK